MIVFNPVNPQLGTIPSRTINIFRNRILNLSNPGNELSANKIHRANYLKKTNKSNKKMNPFSSLI